MCLAGARRPLNRQYRRIELSGNSDRELELRLVLVLAELRAAQARCVSAQESARGTEVVAPRRHLLADAVQRLFHHLARHMSKGKHRPRVYLGHFRPLPNVDRSPSSVDPVDGSESALILKFDLVVFVEIALLLGERVSVDDGPRRLALLPNHWSNPLDERHAGHGASFVEQLVVGQVAETEVFPPRRLVLATMVIEQIGEDPAPLLFSVSLADDVRNVAEKPRAKRLD